MKASAHRLRALVLGSQGLVGRVVSTYLNKIALLDVVAVGRNEFNNSNPNHSLNQLTFKYGQPNIIINCIGLLRPLPTDIKSPPTSEYISINAVLPHTLSSWCEQNCVHLLHISTDSVFAASSKLVYEDTRISAEDHYAASKYLGEPNSPIAITIRTSFLGFDPRHQRGLLELSMHSKSLTGFTNQLWSGCTVLQFAQFITSIISPKEFRKLRTAAPLFHFVPLGPISKYKIIKNSASLLSSTSKVISAKGSPVTRRLASKYDDLIITKKYSSDIKSALKDLINFENLYMKD